MSKLQTPFGPWSTALHSDLELHLNAFWRKRLGRLAAAAKTRQGLSRRTIIGLFVVGVIIVAIPAIRFSRGPARPPGPFGHMAYPSQFEQQEPSRRPEGWEDLRDQLQARREVLYDRLTDEWIAETSEDVPLIFLPPDTDSLIIQELRHLRKTSSRDVSLRLFSDGERVQVKGWTQGNDTVAETIKTVLGIRIHQIEGDTKLLSEVFTGGWIFTRDPMKPPSPPSPAEISVVESALYDQLGLDVRLEFKTTQRDVYVARGNYRFTSIADSMGRIHDTVGGGAEGPFHIPARRTRTGGTIAYSFSQFLQEYSQVLMTPIIDEVTSSPSAKGFFLHFRGEPPEHLSDHFAAETEEKVIRGFCRQTGLSLTKEKRSVEILSLTLN